jgi:hypothetical protein
MTIDPTTDIAEARLQPICVGALQGQFFVPDYQRGYRWGEHEVEQLLDDINDHVKSQGSEYYLQPLVVKPMTDGAWELVDGQQRLTTLYLILRRIKEFLPQTAIRYSLEYQTRPGSAEFLDDPNESLSESNIDFHHMFHAYKFIGEWFDHQTDATAAAIDIYRALTSTVFLIWYEAPQAPGFDSRELFTRLNVGRIPLTDAELVKASLLSRVERKAEVAAQWDSFERDLRAPEVWAFVTGDPGGQATRIGLLLDTVADLIGDGPRPKVRKPFSTYQALRDMFLADVPSRGGVAVRAHDLEQTEGPTGLWNRVVDLHSLIIGWYEDRKLFHKVGYLIATRQATFFELVEIAAGIQLSEFDARLDDLIRDSLKLSWHGVASLGYGNGRAGRVLLLMNVETIRKSPHSSERYSFDAHARRLWTLEHIHAQRSEGLNRAEQWTSWLNDHANALDVLPFSDAERADVRQRIADALPTITNEVFESLRHEIVSLFSVDDVSEGQDAETADRAEMDSIANLALLSSTDNSVLNNSVFEVKRRHLISLNQQGSFIPVCTRNVFLKYYATGASAQHIHFWGPSDKIAYLDAMKAALDPYLLEDLPENDPLEDPELIDDVEVHA